MGGGSGQSIDKSRVLKSLTIIVSGSSLIFSSVHVMKFGGQICICSYILYLLGGIFLLLIYSDLPIF